MSKTNYDFYLEYDETIWTKIVFDDHTNGYVVVHQHHGQGELKVNLQIGLQLVKLGFRVELLAETKIGQSADATLDGVVWEFKSTNATKSSVQNRLRLGKEQSPNILLEVPIRFILRELLRGIISAVVVDSRAKIQNVGLLFTSRDHLGLIVLTREEIKSLDFRKLLIHFDDTEDYV